MAETSYIKTVWVNNVTKLNADNMNHIENGIEAATVEINTLNGDLANKASIDYVDNAIASSAVSPTVETETITGGTKVTITDKDGAHEFDVMNGVNGAAGKSAYASAQDGGFTGTESQFNKGLSVMGQVDGVEDTDALGIDTTVTQNSGNLITSGAVYTFAKTASSQVTPLFAQSVDELNVSGDTTKLYVLPDGYIYAYINGIWTSTGHAFVPADYEDRIISLENRVVQTTGQSTTAVMSQKATTVEINALKDDLADLEAWHILNKFDSESVKTNAIKSPYTIDEMLNNSIILSDGSIRTDGLKADKGNLMSPLIEVGEGIYGLKVKCYGNSLIIGSLGNQNNGYGLFASDGVTPVEKASIVDKGNNIYLITVPSNAKYIRFVARKGSNDDTNLDKTLEAFNSWILLPDATDDITDEFFNIKAKENGNIEKIKRIDGSYLNIVDAEARNQIAAVNEKVDAIPTTFGRRTCAIFKKVCCIGDSYTAGYIMNSNGTAVSDNDYSWVEHMKNITGRKYVNCGISGASARIWLTDERGLAKAQLPENKAQAYLIGLQINDASTSMPSYTPVGSVEDIGTDAETYYGCMSKIVNEIFAINPLAHVFIQTQPKNYTGVHTPYREAVINIVSHFQSDGVHTNQVHLLDLLPYYKLYQAAGCNDSMVNGHFTAVGWEYCAEILAYAWSNYINQNPLKFQDVNLIPYGESN